MKKFLWGMAIICGFHSVVAAQIFEINDASEFYNVRINVVCDQGVCSDQGTVSLYKKSDQSLFQEIVSENLYFDLQDNLKPSVNVIQLYGEQSPLIFDDFNFDCSEDLAIRNGNEGSYGGPSYDVYVYNKTRKKFVLSQELTSLTYENLGMFQVDHDSKRIVTLNKSGCCYHITEEYQIIANKGLVKVKEFIEDARSGSTVPEEQVKVTERNLIKGKWVEKVKFYPLDEYYKN